MTVNAEPGPLLHAIGARRQTQQHLDRLSRQIAARARRQATTARISMRIPRRHRLRPVPSDKVLFQERFERLTSERWSEFNALTIRLFWEDQTIERLRKGDPAGAGPKALVGRPGLVTPVDGDEG